MIKNYYVNINEQPSGEHEVHTSNCPHPPLEQNRRTLGSFSRCQDAIRAAGQIYLNVDGCAYCVPECHSK